MASLTALRTDSATILEAVVDNFRPEAERERLLKDYDLLAQHFLVVAVAALLVEGNAQELLLNLCRLAENGRRLFSLMRARKLRLPPPSKCATAVVAALESGDFALSRSVATAANSTWDRDSGEYEDEALWSRILQALGAGAPETLVSGLLEQLEALEPNLYGNRVAVVRAALARDVRAFSEAFIAAHDAHAAEIDKRASSFGTPTTAFAPHRFVWHEGVALLRLAARDGVKHPGGELRMCPPLALVRMTARYEGDWAIRVGPVP